MCFLDQSAKLGLRYERAGVSWIGWIGPLDPCFFQTLPYFGPEMARPSAWLFGLLEASVWGFGNTLLHFVAVDLA